MNSLILRTTTRFVAILLVVFSIFVLVRGHNEPGGGFIGGLQIATAFMLYGLAFSPQEALRLLRVDPRTLMGLGLLLAGGSGLVAPLLGEPYMTGQWLPFAVPVIKKIGTVVIFDVGVYLVVLGTTLLILLTLSEE